VINISGSLVLGFLTGVALYHGFPSAPDNFIDLRATWLSS